MYSWNVCQLKEKKNKLKSAILQKWMKDFDINRIIKIEKVIVERQSKICII